jgi:UDP-N-acetylmuramoyl-L-alanyl-D-glutamate--2,6-diaminopimelate ligase
VFSASGDRDHSKRVEMARAAASAEQIVVSDFHPRSEDPASIRAELMQALKNESHKVTEIADPTAAIRHAVIQAESGSAVIWCGPGSLKYREIAGEKIEFDPAGAVLAALEEWQ